MFILDEWLITAAHCIVEARNLTAHLGITDISPIIFNNVSFPSSHVAIPVLKYSLHPYPGFFLPIAWNDIGAKKLHNFLVNQFITLHDDHFIFHFVALIRLPRKVKFTEHIQPVKLPNTCKAQENIEVVAIGNGATSDDSSVSPSLQYTILKTDPLKVCRKVYPILFWRKSVFCASHELKEQSICRGDSGGPLINQSDNTLIGLSCFVRMGNFKGMLFLLQSLTNCSFVQQMAVRKVSVKALRIFVRISGGSIESLASMCPIASYINARVRHR